MYQKFWQLGNIVKLRTPFSTGTELVQSTQGFTHGIIVRITGEDQHGVSEVALHLYDPLSCTIYIEKGQNGIPTYAHFSVNELIPYKEASSYDYTPIS